MSLRFKVGELARIVVACTPEGQRHLGLVCEVVEVGPFRGGVVSAYNGKRNFEGDYLVVVCGEGDVGLVNDYQLRKLDPPAEPASLTRESREEIEA